MWSLFASLALSAQAPECDPLPGWEAVAEASTGKYLVLGETHGSSEAPAATAEFVCAVSNDGPVLLAIEFSSSSDDAFQRAWAAPPEQFRQRMFEEVPLWGKRNDGVASAAMLEMLERLHALKSAGRLIDIVAFNGAKNDTQRAAFAELPGQESHEAAQAANIREAAMAKDYRHVVVLVGNLHASKARTSLSGIEIRPMAMLLDQAEHVISLRMGSDGGESWNCVLDQSVQLKLGQPVTSDMLDCGAHTDPPTSDGKTRGFHLDQSIYPGAFDGVFALGPITASPLAEID